MIELGFFALTIVDLTAAAIISAAALSPRMQLYPSWHKLGMLVACIGLIAQAYRNMVFLTTGQMQNDMNVPLWAFKDCGISLVAFGYAALGFRHYRANKKTTQEKKPNAKPRGSRSNGGGSVPRVRGAKT